MAEWNVQQLKDLCRENGREYPSVFIESLSWRRMQAEIHAEEANRIWKELFQGSFTLGDERFSKTYFLYAAHVECCAHCLQSMIDLLMQITNLTVLKGKYPEKEVNIWNILKTMKDDNIYEKMRISLKSFVIDGSFQYLNSFCNTIKHRKLLKSNFRAEYGDDNRNESGVVYEKFCFDNKEYPEMWGSDIIDTHKKQIISLIISAGQSINEFMNEIES